MRLPKDRINPINLLAGGNGMKDVKQWQYSMHSAVRTAIKESESDVVNLYLKLEKASKSYLESGEMKEGDSFRVPLEDGTELNISFFKKYSTVVAKNMRGQEIDAVTEADSYKKEYRFLDALTFTLQNINLGIGPRYSSDFEKAVMQAKSGDVYHFDNNKVYVCVQKSEEQVSFVRISNGDKTPKIEDIDKYEHEVIIKDSPLSFQSFYKKVRDEYTDDTKFRVASITSARELLNSLLINRQDTKTLQIGPNKFFVKPSKEGKGLSYYSSNGDLISEERMLFLVGWLQASPNTVQIVRTKNHSEQKAFEDVECKRIFERMMAENDFTGALEFVSGYLAENDNSLQIDMSSYVAGEDSFEPVSYIFKSVNGELSIKKLSYIDNDFSKEVSKVESVSVTDVINYCKEKYDDRFELIKTGIINSILKDYPYWHGDFLEKYIEKSTLDKIGQVFSVSMHSTDQNASMFMDIPEDEHELS